MVTPLSPGRSGTNFKQKHQKVVIFLFLLLLIAYQGYSKANRSIRDFSSLQLSPTSKTTYHFEEGISLDDENSDITDNDVELFIHRGFDAVVTIATGTFSAMRLVSGAFYFLQYIFSSLLTCISVISQRFIFQLCEMWENFIIQFSF